MLMAGSVILTVPIIVLFFLSERWLAGGLPRAPRRADPVPEVVSFTAPNVALVACEEQPLDAGVGPRTWFSGISAGTE